MSYSSVLFPRGEESSALFPRGEDGHQVTRISDLWQSGGEAEPSKKEEIEYAEVVEGSAPHKEVKAIDAIQRQVSDAQQTLIQGYTIGGKGKPKSGDNVATRPPKGRSEGKGGKSSHVWRQRGCRSPSRFALHASEEMFTAISPVKCES